jgi:hypothetical protein
MVTIVVYYLNNRLVDKKDINKTDRLVNKIIVKESNFRQVKEYYYER